MKFIRVAAVANYASSSSSPSSSASQIIAKTVNLLNSPRLTANLLRDLCFMYFLRFFLLLVPYYFHFARTKHKDSQRQMGKITANAKASNREGERERGTITTAK